MISSKFKVIFGLVFLCAVSFISLPLEARCSINFGFGANFFAAPRPCRPCRPVILAPAPRVPVCYYAPAPERVVIVRDRYYAPRPYYSQRVEVYEYSQPYWPGY